MPKKIFTQELEGTRRRGRPRKGWKEEVERDLQVLGVRRWRVGGRQEKMEGHCSMDQSPQWAVVPMEEEEEEEEEEVVFHRLHKNYYLSTKYSGKSSKLMTKYILSYSVLFLHVFLSFPSFLFCLLPAHALHLKPKEISSFDHAGFPTVSRRLHFYTLFSDIRAVLYFFSNFMYRFHSASHSVH